MTESQSRIAADVEALVERALQQRARQTRRRFAAVASAAVVGVAALLWGGPALAQAMCAQTLPPGLTTFCADTPARAGEVNANFQKLVDWLTQKTGPVGVADVTVNGHVSAKNVWKKIYDSYPTCTSGGCTINVTGPSDRFYKIYFQGFLQPGAGVDSRFILQFNGLSSNFRSHLGTDGDYIIQEFDSTGIYLARTVFAQQIIVAGEVDLFTNSYRVEAVGSGVMDVYQSNTIAGNVRIAGSYQGSNNTSINSLTFFTNQNGSYFNGHLVIYAMGPP